MESVGNSYLLRADAGRLDLLAFRGHRGRARAACTDGAITTACSWYERSLALWRGNPLDEVDALRAHPGAVSLIGQHTALVMDYAEAALGAGLHRPVLPHLQMVTAREPLNEKAHAQLMIALARAGQQAAALEVFDALRRRLDEELGVYPGAELSQAHERVLRQETQCSPRHAARRRPDRFAPCRTRRR
jgi:Bacterial transcriptional activator domain